MSVKSSSWQRWLILLFTCIMMIGNYYSYDIPAALNTQLDEYFGKEDDFEIYFSLLYTLYSIPNVILPFFGGYFVDRLGVRLCLLAFASLITIGQVIFAFGVSIKSWPVMFLGRIVFGFGGESLGVGNSALLSQWFMGKELAFAFGLNLSIARLGSVFNNLLSPTLANSANVQFAVWFGAILCGGSVFSVICLSSIDKSFETGDTMHTQLLSEEEEEDNSQMKTLEGPPEEKTSLRDVFSFTQAFWVLVISCVVVYGCVLPFNNIASPLLLERDFFMANPDDCAVLTEGLCEYDAGYQVSKDCPSSAKYQPPLPWKVTVDGVYYEQVESADVDCSSDAWSSDSEGCTYTFCDRQAKAQLQVTTVMSIPYIISASLSPFLGAFVDRFGYRAVIATIAPAALIVVHSMLGFTNANPVGPLVGQGLSYAMFAAVIWPSIPLVVEPKFIGLAYGVTTSVQNLGLAVFPVIIAALYTANNNEYIPAAEEFFVALACLGFLVGLYLNYYDFCNGNIFNNPGQHTVPGNDDFDDKVKVFNQVDKVSTRASSRDGRMSGDGTGRRVSSEIFATSMMH